MSDEARMLPEERQDLAGVVSRYRRYLPLVLATTIGMMILFGVVTHFLPKKYTSTAELTFAPQASVVKVPGQSDPALSDQARDAAIDAQVQLVQSLAVASEVVQTLHLDRDPQFQKAAANYTVKSGQQNDAIAAAVLNGIRARRVGQTSLFDVSYTDADPLQATEIANAFARAYLHQNVQQKLTQSRGNTDLIAGRLEELRRQAEQADAAVARYKNANNLMTAAGSTLPEQEISSLNEQLAQTRVQQAEANARYSAALRQLRSGGGGGDIGDALSSPVISDLRRQEAEVSRKIAELSQRYGPQYPDLVDSQKELAQIEAQERTEISRILSNLKAQTDVAGQRTASLESSLSGARGRLSQTVGSSVALNDLDRRATAARELYESFLSSGKQENAAQALVQPDARINALATPPLKPSSPNMPVNLFLGLILGLAIGIAAAYIMDRWSVGLNTIDDIDRLLHQNFLNSIPTLDSAIDKRETEDPVEAVTRHPLSLYSEAFRSLAASLMYSDSGEPVKVVGLTSALPKEGKTTTSACVARVLALSGQKVLLMDGDMRRRSATQMLAPQADRGLIEVLKGEAEFREVVLQDSSGAWLLPLAPGANLAKQPFDSPEFAELMRHLRQNFDAIIIDTAPVLAVVDTRLLLKHIDSLALLARWRRTPVKAIRAAIHQLETVGGEIRGVAMTLVNLKTQSKSGYGDASYYYADMKDYYAN